MSEITTGRPHKGKSLLIFPVDYTVVDIETTGLDPRWDEIIELSALRVRNGEVCGRFSTLVKPENQISDFITCLTGIANEDVADAPTIVEALPGFLGFIGADIIVGHNVHFDVNFIYDAATIHTGKPVTNDIVDTMRLSRHILPQLKHHRLHDVADALGIDPAGAHRGLVDCETTHAALQGLRAVADLSGINLTSISAATHGVRAADITAEPGRERPDSPLYGKVCVFTGTLERMQRKEAMQLVVNLGGTCGDNVTAKTNFLILGNNDYCTTIKDSKSTKQKKAEALILKGNDLQILSETAFYDMISEDGPAGVTSTEAMPKKTGRKIDTFGCCSRYEACSDAMKCIHPDPVFASSCQYRQNLLAGRIFYGKNKTAK